MNHEAQPGVRAALVAALLLAPMLGAHAQSNAVSQNEPAASNAQALRQQLDEQDRQLQRLKQAVVEQEARQQELRRTLQHAQGQEPAAAQAAQTTQTAPPPANTRAEDRPRPVRVGVAPAAEPQPAAAVANLFEQPGILTPRNTLVMEPSFQYAYSSSNRVALVGYTIIPALLIGLIDVREVKRNTFTAALTARYGLTNRFEIEGKVPYVYRSDSTISREYALGSASDKVFDTSGKHLGDIEVAARYQLTDGLNGRPYLIGALRFKSRTGKDPFDVETDCITRCDGPDKGTGLPLQLPTGSGFYSLQPSLTWLLPSDPVVFFGGVSYTHNFKRDNIQRLVRAGERYDIGTVEPGGVIGLNFGMGMSLNERASFSLGVELNSVGRTKQNGDTVSGSVRTQLASLLMGYSYRYDQKTSLNVAVGAGLTRDTPDLSINFRIPRTF